jgi:hypothetical protein
LDPHPPAILVGSGEVMEGLVDDDRSATLERLLLDGWTSPTPLDEDRIATLERLLLDGSTSPRPYSASEGDDN